MNIENQGKQYQNAEYQGGGLKGALSSSAFLENGFLQDFHGAKSINGASFREILNVESLAAFDKETDDILNSLDFAQILNLNTANIDKMDALFFINVINQAGYTNYTVQDNGSLIDAANYRGIEISKTLSDMLFKMHNNPKSAVRLDFDNNVTVILRLSDDGKINANFIPGDKAVEEYLRNNIPYLKQRFDEQNIPYANLSYKEHKQQRNNDGEQKNKEKNNE